MKKRTHKRSARNEKDHLGCMAGLISIFDFRQRRSTRRLISDRRRGSGKQPVGAIYSKETLDSLTDCEQRHEGDTSISPSTDGDESQVKSMELRKTSVKALMDEELHQMQKTKKQLPKPALEQIRQDLEIQGSLAKNSTQADRNSRLGSRSSKVEMLPLEEEVSRNKHSYQEIVVEQKNTQFGQKQSILEDRFGEALEAFLNEKFIEAKRNKVGGLYQPKDLKDALDILNSNKELFLKLLQDPNSPLAKHMEELRISQTEKLSNIESCKVLAGEETAEKEYHSSSRSNAVTTQNQSQKLRHHKFFGRKDKTKDKKPHKANDIHEDTSNRIVILKPSNGPPQSHFSLGEIKRKLQNAIGESRKERYWMLMERFPNKRDASAPNEIPSPGGMASELHVRPTSDTRAGPKECTSQQRESSLYEEAKKHLSYMLDMEDEDDQLKVREVPRTLQRMISLTESKPSSPRRSSLEDNSEYSEPPNPPESSSLQRPDADDAKGPDTILQEDRSSSEFEERDKADATEKQDSLNKLSSPEGCSRIERTNEIVSIGDNNIEDLDFEPNKLETSEENSRERLPDHSSQSLQEEKSQTLCVPEFFAAGTVIIYPIEDIDHIYEKPDRPSPVSVLEPPFLDDDASPASWTTNTGEIQPKRIEFDGDDDPILNNSSLLNNLHASSNFELVRKILEASGLSSEEMKGRWPLSDPPLDPSLLDEVQAPDTQFSEDQKLPFDCINEVLLEIFQRSFGNSPWTSFIKAEIRPIPRRNDIIQEVMGGIDRHLAPPGPRTLDQIVEKDLARDKSWLDLRQNLEENIFELGDSTLDKLMEELILELWD